MDKQPPQKTKRKILSSGRLVATYEYANYKFADIHGPIRGVFYVVTRGDMVHGPYKINDSRFSSIIK